MATPSWRKWFFHCTHTVAFALRGFFALAIRVLFFVFSFLAYALRVTYRRYERSLRPLVSLSHSLVGHVRRIKNLVQQSIAFEFTKELTLALLSLCLGFYRKHRRVTVVAGSLLLFVFIATSVFFSFSARAEKEVHAYISPSMISGEGVENPTAAGIQDLSADARIADFALDYSARFAFGSYANIPRSVSPRGVATSSATTTVDASSGTTTRTGVSATTTSTTIPVVASSTAPASTTPTTPAPAASPSIIDSVQSVIHGILPSIVPAPQVVVPAPGPVPAPVTETVAPATASSTANPPTSGMIRSTFAKLFGAKIALALDAPATAANTESAPAVSVTPPTTPAVTPLPAPAQVSSPAPAVVTAPAPETIAPASSVVSAPAADPTPASPSATTAPTPAPTPSVSTVGSGDTINSSSTTISQNPAPAAVTGGDATPEDRDPYKVASCTLFGKQCHLLVMEGFGVGGELSKYPVRNAQLMVSVAGRAAPADIPDRVVFRAYRNGKWVYLGEQQVSGEFDNSSHGGFLTFPLGIGSWSELANMTIAIEYVREGQGDASVLLDAAWVDVGFAAEEAPDDLALLSPNVRSALLARDAEMRIRERDHLRLDDGTVVNFTNLVAQTPGAKLRVALTKERHAVLGSGEEYVGVTNVGKSPERVRLSFHFPEEGGRVTDIAQYSHNVPHKVVEARTAPIAYLCAGGWIAASSTDEIVTKNSYSCAEGTEVHVCSSLSEDKTNCLSEITAVGQQEDTVYRRDFVPDAVFSGSFRNDQNIFGRAMDALLSEMPSDMMPTSVKEVSYTNSFDVEPGTTQYFRVNYDTPINTRGDFYVEAVAASGAYGLGHAEFDGSWNWRMPVDVSLPYAEHSNELAVPIALDKMPLEFWSKVKHDGADIRFTDEEAAAELPYWLADFNVKEHTGLAWVRLPEGGGIVPRIFLYAGNPNAETVSRPWAPFITAGRTPRGVLISKSGEDADVTITALAPQVHAVIDGHDERTLLYGETALFEHVANASVIRSTGPISAKAHSVFARAVVAPYGLAGLSAELPEHTLELAMLPATNEAGEAKVGKQSVDLAAGSVFRMPIDGEVLASSSIPALFLAEEADKASLLAPIGSTIPMQLSGSAVLNKRESSVRAVCEGNHVFGAFDTRGSLLATSTCGVMLSGPFDEGTLVRMFKDVAGGTIGARFFGSDNSTVQIDGRDVVSRGAGAYAAEAAFGEPEYVLPGEHRLFDRLGDKERPHVNRFLSLKREFSAEEVPTFKFQYKPQSNSFFRSLRKLFGVPPFSVDNIVVEQSGQPVPIETTVEYGKNNEWTIRFAKDAKMRISPGKLTLRMQIHEGVSTYDDSYDFYWALLAVNFNKATYEKGETAEISLGALSDTGNTICDAHLKLFITTPASTTEEVPVSTSGKCDGNNIVTIPDYTAKYTPVDEGKYFVRLVRLDDTGNILADVRDAFAVVPHMTYVIERTGPTRINPTAFYDMTLRVFAREAYKGKISELIPGDFEIIERGGGVLEWVDDTHAGKHLHWDVDMKAGEVYQFTYRFDAPDKSPYIFFLGPATIGDGDTAYTEPRTWQIASDAAGKMIIYWDAGGNAPAGWDLMSTSTGPFFQKYLMGSSTYGITGGATTHTHTFTPSVGPALYSTSITASTINIAGLIYYKDHTHNFTPTFSVGSNLPVSQSLRILRAQSAGEVPLPLGAIVFFETVPATGWTTYTAMEGFYPYGESAIFGTQGAATDMHTISGSTGGATGGVRYNSGTGAPFVSNTTHTHVVTSTTTNVTTTDPPYVTYRMGKSTVAALPPNDAIVMWDNAPAAGWINMSDAGQIMSNRFVRVAASSLSVGGHATHNHSDILGDATGAAVGTTMSDTTGGSMFGSNPTHTHKVDLTGFSNVSNLPPYITVIYAKRSVGIPDFTQIDYRFFDNVNHVTPIDPWPAGATDIAENTPVDDSTYRFRPGSIFRVRMDVQVQNATATAAAFPLKLQYSTDGVCSSALNWNDVGLPGSATPLRGYHNSLVAEGASLPSALLSTSTPGTQQAYHESSGVVNFVRDAGIGTNAEWDWALEAGPTLASSTRYCLRMVENSGKVFGNYTRFPNFLTNGAPMQPLLNAPFNHAKIATTSPTLTFAASDPEGNNLHYEVQIDSDPAFGAPVVALSTTNAATRFANVNNPSNKAPYTPGDTISFVVPPATLVNGTTYWWRVRAKDPAGSTQFGNWSIPRAMTIDTTLTTSAWFQTTDAQFVQDLASGITISGNAANLAVGSTTGSIYSPEIIFTDGTLGTVWGSLAFTKDAGAGINFHIEYKDTLGNWYLIPDALVPGNSAGITVSGTSLKAIDPLTYPSLRVRADFTNIGTPVLSDWTVNWAFKTLAPVITSPFSHAKVATTTPTFIFSSTDPQNFNIRYQFQYSTNPTFAASTTCFSDGAGMCGTFANMSNPVNVSPFTSGQTIKFTLTPALVNGTTYYYRIGAFGVGGGAWSFWSEVRSFTVDTALMYTTWFQTMQGQFNMDTLSGSYANSANSVAVATSSDEVLMVYGKGSDPAPKYRFYSTGTLGTESSALSINSTVLWATAKASPTNDQFMLGTMGADRAIKFQVLENSIWSRMFTMSGVGPSATRRSYDLAYESQSGHALVVACNGNNATYNIFDGSSWGTEQTLTLGFGVSCELVRLASSPTKNEIVAAFRNTGSTYHVEVWNGSSWRTGTSRFDFSASAAMAEPAHDGIALEYEKGGANAVVVVSANAARGFRYRVWNGTTWGVETAYAGLGGNDANRANAQFEWGNMKRDPAGNSIMFCGISQYSNIDDGAFTDYVRWTGAAWTPAVAYEGQYYPYTRHAQSADCVYETKAGRTGRIMTVADESWNNPDGSTNASQTTWDSMISTTGVWQSGLTYTSGRWGNATYQFNTGLTWTSILARAAQSGDILAMLLQPTTNTYVYKMWNGTVWSALQTIAVSSVTSSPFGNPFDLETQEGLSQGRIFSAPIKFADGQAPAWRQATFTETIPGGTTAPVSVEYLVSPGNWARIPDVDLPGNSLGTSTSPIDLSGLNVGTYSTIRLRADLSCGALTNCPTLNDWSVNWALGLPVSGKARAYDRTTLVTTGTVKVAVNGVEQIGKTAAIDAAGNWSIPGVSYKNGDIISTWIDAAGTSSRAVAVARFMGAGNMGNMELSSRWLAIGDTTQTGETIANTDLALYDNNDEVATTRPDIFFNVDASQNLNVDSSSASIPDASLLVATGTTWRPKASGGVTNTMYSHSIFGTTNADSNTIKIAGDWRNAGVFTPGTGRTIFNATSSIHTINNTGATQFKFNNVTFGEIGTSATWQPATPLYMTGSLAINYGALSPGVQPISIEDSLSIGANGVFTKGTGAVTFLGVAPGTWSDLTAIGQDMGTVNISGSPKSLSLSSSVTATDILITPGDSFFFGVNTLTLLGNFQNDGSTDGGTGRLLMAPAGAATIRQGTALLGNITLQSGNVTWADTDATTTGDVLVTGGTHAFPALSFTVGGGFAQTGGTFTPPSQLIMNGAVAGKTMSALSSFNNLLFTGTGSWIFTSSATTTGNTIVSGGSLTLPAGTLAVGGNFINTANIISNGGTLFMNGGIQSIALNNKSLGGVTAAGTTLTFSDVNVTTTGSVIVNAGATLNLPMSGSLTVGGSFINNGTANANASLLAMNRSAGPATLAAGTMVLSSLSMGGAGLFTINGNTRVSATTTLNWMGSFTLQSGAELRVDGFFTNAATNANTTWTGSTLRLTSGATMSINTKSIGADDYGAIILDNGTQLRMWNSSATSVTTNLASALYGQNWAGIAGALRIYGVYAQNSGTAYWDYNTDFDGTALGVPRIAMVSLASGAIANFASGTVLEIQGGISASTTVNALAGTYAINLATSTLAAQYAVFTNLGIAGINITGSSTIVKFDNVDLTAGINAGYTMTLGKEVIDANASKQFAYDFFRNGGFVGARNVAVTATSTNYIRFKQHAGGMDGEAFDNDPSGDPGEVRWDNSSYIISISGTVYDKTLVPMGATVCDGVTAVVRVQVTGGASFGGVCGAGGNFTINGVTFSGETTMSIYLKGVPTAKAVTVTRGASVNLTGIKLYQDRIILRHEDTLPMTNAALSGFTAANDVDMLFSVSLGALSVPANNELWVWSGKTYIPGGNVTTGTGSGNAYGGAFHIDNGAVVTALSNEQFSIGGRLQSDAGAVFNTASSTVTMTATDARTIVTVNPLSLWNLSFTGSGTWTLGSDILVANTFNLASGTLAGTGNITAQNGATGNGALLMTAGTFALPRGGNFGGANVWSPFNLVLGDGSTLSTTTKTGVGTTTVSGVLTVNVKHNFNLATNPLILSGTGTPLVVQGNIDTTSGTVTYASAGGTNVANIAYNNLAFQGTGTYVLPNLNLTVKGDFIVGGGVSTPTVSGLTNNPVLSILGNVSIASGATYVASGAATTTVKGNWTNVGTFTNSLGIVQFIGAGAKTINPGNSPFGIVDFNDPLGTWTITTNATATALSLSSAASWILTSGKTLEITSSFANLIGNTKTTWTGSTLYLNTGNRVAMNPKNKGADTYNILKLGANTQVALWNSSSTQIITPSGSGVYSQNHAGVNGDLYIFGDYKNTNLSEYWDSARDFDGTTLGTPRAARVRFTASSTATYTGTSILEMIGSPSATTTIRAQSGTYGLSIGGASTSMQFLDVSDMNATGIALAGSVKVTSLDDVVFRNPSGVGTMMTVAATVITANPVKVMYRDGFISGGGANVTATGVTVSAWRFVNHYGGRDGEAFDVDPAGNPGYLVWDDSTAQLTIAGHFYRSDGVTPSTACNGVTQNVQLRVINASTTMTTACSAVDGSFSIPNILPAGSDTLLLFATSSSGVKAATYAYNPMTNIADYDMYENTVIVRNEQAGPITNLIVDGYDKDQYTNIPARVTAGALTLDTNTKLIVWDNKTFAPGGAVAAPGNTNISAIDGDVEIRAGASWTTSGTDVYTIGGDLSMGTNASVTGGAGNFTFTSTVAGKMLTASTSATLTNLTFNGTGSWSINGVATTTGDVNIATGAVTLPATTFAIGGTFNNQGTFAANGGTVLMTANTAGNQIRTSGSSFKDLAFIGAGSWSFLDNATTTGNFTIASGAPTLPAGTLAVGGDFQNIGGSFNANGGTLSVTGAGGRLLVPGGSAFANLRIANGTFTTNVANATTTGDVFINSGSLTLPTSVFAVGGTFKNIAGSFTAGATSTVLMNATTTGKLINPGSSTFTNLIVDGAGGGFTIEANATATKAVTLKTANAFVQSSSTRLVVQDLFTNNVGGTWTGSTLRIEKSGTSTINTKTAPAASYNAIELGTNAQVSVWNASSTNVTTAAGAALYAQNFANIVGALRIYGNYVRTSGADYWSATTDFDGAPIASRAVNVRFAAGSAAAWTSGTQLRVVGTSGAVTSIQSLSGTYGLSIQDGTFEGRYFKLRNTTGSGLQLLGNTTIVALENSDLATGIDTGNILTIDSGAVNANSGAVLGNNSFVLDTGHLSGTNAFLNGTTTNALYFSGAIGNLAGEAFDNDGGHPCGAFRWDDSLCQFVDQRYYRWRNDNGGEAVPDSEWFGGAASAWTYRERVQIVNSSSSAATNVAVKVNIPYQAQMQADYRDIRFTAGDGTTTIPFWIETYTTASANVWVKVPVISPNAGTDVYVYYGNPAALAGSSGTSTFTYFFDGESGLAGMTGDTAAFRTLDMPSRSPIEQLGLKYLRSLTDIGQTLGMANLSAGVVRGSTAGTGVTIRENILIDGASNDDTCLTFGANSTSGSNWGFCVSPQQATKNVRLVKDATKDGFLPNVSAEISTQDVLLATPGWYTARIDWEAIGKITAWLYDPNGVQVANISAVDSYNPGSGIGFSYWYQKGGWDNVTATPFIIGTPTVVVLAPQQHGGATWIAGENTPFGTAQQGNKLRLRFGIRNTGTPLLGQMLELDYAIKGAAANCESVGDGSYTPVPTVSACVTDGICMSTSTVVADGAATTPLLSTPKGLNFIAGRFVADPSNKTTGLSIPGNNYTEVEYALQFNANAVQPTYCFRVSNNGTRLVSYTKVAEASVSHPPKISNWNWTTPTLSLLNEGGTTTVMATGTVTDYSGYADINSVATGTIYRKSLTESCTANDNNCYTPAKTSCALSACSGISCMLTCKADLQFFAEPTDIGTYAADIWTVTAHVHNQANVFDTASADAELNTLKALAFTTGAVDYGSLDIGSTTPAFSNPSATLQNTGNAQFGLDIAGSDLVTTGSTIAVNNEKVATSTFDFASCSLCTTLSTSTTPLSLIFPKPNSTTPVTNNLYFGLYIPFGTKPLTHDGQISAFAN